MSRPRIAAAFSNIPVVVVGSRLVQSACRKLPPLRPRMKLTSAWISDAASNTPTAPSTP